MKGADSHTKASPPTPTQFNPSPTQHYKIMITSTVKGAEFYEGMLCVVLKGVKWHIGSSVNKMVLPAEAVALTISEAFRVILSSAVMWISLGSSICRNKANSS